METGVDPGIILLLGVVLSGVIIAITGVVGMFGEWVKVKGPKGWINFVAGIIVAFLGLAGLRFWG